MKPKKQGPVLWIVLAVITLLGVALYFSKDSSPPKEKGVFYYSGPKRPKGGGAMILENGKIISEAEASKYENSETKETR